MTILPRRCIIEKESIKVLADAYKTPNTIPLAFSFQFLHDLVRSRQIESHSLDGKDLFIINDFFTEDEGRELREFSTTAAFSQKIYGNEMSSSYGEAPAKMMNGKERWQFFHRPPLAILALFDLFGSWSHKIDAKVITLPWCLSDQKTTSNCLATNFLTENSKPSTEYGKHRDYDPAQGLAFTIPCLYDQAKEFDRFENGALGHPLMLTVMVYATATNFQPDFGMGTLFYSCKGHEIKVPCRHRQMVIFEGDILHTIEASHIPPEIQTWRVSYVFKIILNPRKAYQSMRQLLRDNL